MENVNLLDQSAETRSFEHRGPGCIRGKRGEGLSSLMSPTAFEVRIGGSVERSVWDELRGVHVWKRVFPIPFSHGFAKSSVHAHPQDKTRCKLNELRVVVGVRPLKECALWIGDFGGKLLSLKNVDKGDSLSEARRALAQAAEAVRRMENEHEDAIKQYQLQSMNATGQST